MKLQWLFLLALAFAILVSVFAVINVEPVSVNYLFGKSELPLILVVLGSVLTGGIIAGSIGSVKIYTLKRKIRHLEKEKPERKEEEGTEDIDPLY